MANRIENQTPVLPELNSVDLYLDQIRSYPTQGFNADQEKFLFGCLKMGLPIDYLPQSYFLDSLLGDQKAEEYINAMEDSQNLGQFVELCNLALPISIAKQAARRLHDPTLLADFIQAGNEGLTIAVKTYDFERKEKAQFSTYASEVIKNKIWELIGIIKHPISIADNMRTVLYKAAKMREKFYRENSRLPNDDEAREMLLTLGISNNKINAAFDAIRRGVTIQPGPLPVSKHDDNEIEEVTLPDPNINVEKEVLDEVFEVQLVDRIAHILTPKQFSALVLNEGLLGHTPLGVVEIAQIEGVTPQAVSIRLKLAHERLLESASELREFLAA